MKRTMVIFKSSSHAKVYWALADEQVPYVTGSPGHRTGKRSILDTSQAESLFHSREEEGGRLAQ